MSVEIEPEKAQEPAGSGPVGPRLARPWWMRPAMHTGIIGAIIVYFLGPLLGNYISYNYARNPLSDMTAYPLLLVYVSAVIRGLSGLGVSTAGGRKIAVKPVPVAEEEEEAFGGV